MPASLRQEHRDATRRRIVAAARKVFVKKGYAKATIDEIIVAAGVSRATLYLHFDSKFALLTAATEKLRAEAIDGARQLSDVLITGDRTDLRGWVEWALRWYARNRPMALAGEEAALSEDKPTDLERIALDCLEPWVEMWPPERRAEARMRFELCRVQMRTYMWGKSHTLFPDQEFPVDLFTEVWWATLKAPQPPPGGDLLRLTSSPPPLRRASPRERGPRPRVSRPGRLSLSAWSRWQKVTVWALAWPWRLASGWWQKVTASGPARARLRTVSSPG